MPPPSLTKRLINHAQRNDVTQGYPADGTIARLREPAQGIADRIETLMKPVPSSVDANAQVCRTKPVTRAARGGSSIACDDGDSDTWTRLLDALSERMVHP